MSAFPATVDETALHGLAGEFVRATEPHSEAHPMALLVQFLVAFGCACGRGAHYQVEADRHYPNQFCVLVGSSSRACIWCAHHMQAYGAPQTMLR